MNTIQFIYNLDGTLLDKNVPNIRAYSNYAYTMQIIAPFPSSVLITAEYALRNRESLKLYDYFRVVKDVDGTYLLGKDVIAESKAYYQTVKDWYVWEAPISQRNLVAISKFRAGTLGVSFSVKDKIIDTAAVNFKGTFGSVKSTRKGDLPLLENTIGDYFSCDMSSYDSVNADKTYLYGEIAVWSGTAWFKGNTYSLRNVLATQEIGIDPGMENMMTEVVTPTLTEDILLDISDNESRLLELTDYVEEIHDVDLPEIVSDVTALEGEITKIKDGTTIVKKAEKDSLGNVIKDNYITGITPTYNDTNNSIYLNPYNGDDALMTTRVEGVALPKVKSTKDGLMAKEDKVKLDALPTNDSLTSQLNAKVDKSTTIIGLDMQDNILLTEFKTALGNATQSVAGLLSATDKARLDALHALLDEGEDPDSVINTINEVLAIFNNYPEGADIVTALNGKVDKIAGKGLSQNDYTDAEKNKVTLSDTHRQATDNPHATTFAQINSKPTTIAGYGITDAYNKEYIDALKDLNGWSSALLTEVALTNEQTIALATLQQYDIIKLFAINTSTNEIDTDSFDTSVGLVDTYEYRLFDNENIKFVIGATNCTFTDTVGGYELKIIGQKYEAQEAENVNYDKTVKNILEAENVQDAIDEIADEVLAPAFVEAEHLALQSEITATNAIEIKDDSGELVKITGNTLPSEDVDVLKAMGIKNDSGVLFSSLTPEEITEQLGIWLEQGYPTHINKLISKSDNLFNGKFNTLTSLESENLIANSDLLIDSNSDGVPDGFTYNNATDISLTNGIAKFTPTAQYASISYYLSSLISGQITYIFARVKSSSPNTRLVKTDPFLTSYHSGNGSYQFLSILSTNNNIFTSINISTNAWTNFTPIEVDYVGAINITDLVSRGILPSGLTNEQYKDILDNALYNNVPLRESDFISVEPSVVYRLIKASENGATHKVIEYTTDNQVVKVNSVDYSGNVKISAPITMNALTRKVKLISDLMNRPIRYDVNGDLQNGLTGYTYIHSLRDVLSIANSKLRITCDKVDNNLGMYFNTTKLKANNEYYLGVRDFYTPKTTPLSLRLNPLNGNPVYFSDDKSIVFKLTYDSSTTCLLYFNSPSTNTWQVGEYYEFKAINTYNITEFKNAGVVDDNGTLFSRLTNDEIKEQMDIWTESGFPDHVIHALYPDGADTAISLKYNDGNAIYYPQVIDELPLDITLRADEYWQDGYIIKQNGNAEASPLGKVFSAWNYGQLEAIYDSGIPADFKIKYAQNTSAQVSTHSEYLKEAREQLDYVTEGYDNLVEKLGDAIFSDKYDSYAGITSDTYEYYGLEGIKEGNTLAIEGAGQSIQNLLGKDGTINATTTVRGVTVTYDNVTGVFTANGTATAGTAFNITIATGMDFGLPVGTPIQLMRYYDDVDGGTVNLNGSYIGYVLLGAAVSNRINENSEALYDPYINGSGNLTANHATNKQQLLLQVWKEGIVFNNFKFKIGIYDGLQLRPFILSSGEPAKSNVTVYNRTANMLDMPTALSITDSGLTLTYDPLVQEFLLSGTATATKDISLSATFDVLSGDRLSIKRLYQSGDVTGVSGTLPRIKLVNESNATIVYNDIYKMTAPEGETLTPDVSFNTGTAPADATLTLKLGITSGQVFDNYRFRLMIHDKTTDIGYVAYRRDLLGNMSVGVNERAVVEFKAIPYGILEFVADSESLNLLYADSITDLNKTYLEYNAGIISPNRKISELTARAELIDNPFRNKVIAIWGDSRESNNPTSDPTGVGDQKDTSWPALLAKKLSATVLNYGLSGGAWAQNTVQQDAASAIVNRVQTEDISASADVIVISSMNDFKLASVLGSPLPANKDKTTFYGAMRLTYDRLATKYPGKKIVLVLPQKRYDETVNYGGGSYYHYLKAQVEVAKEYGIPIVDLYHNFPNSKPTFYATNMLNDTHFSAVGNDKVAELVARELIGNGNKGDMDLIPPIPTTDGTYKLQVVITGGIPVFSWVA